MLSQYDASLGEGFMRRAAKLLSTGALAVGLTLGLPAVAHAGPYEFAGSYPSQTECVTAGDQGVIDQSWTDYRCTLFEGVWDLYVRI
jgi:hypothetical protein